MTIQKATSKNIFRIISQEYSNNANSQNDHFHGLNGTTSDHEQGFYNKVIAYASKSPNTLISYTHFTNIKDFYVGKSSGESDILEIGGHDYSVRPGSLVVTAYASSSWSYVIGTTQFIKLSTPTPFYYNLKETFKAALGSTEIFCLKDTKYVYMSYFDTTYDKAVIVKVAGGKAENTNHLINADSDFSIVCTIDMSVTDYVANFGTNNLAFTTGDYNFPLGEL